MRFAMEPLAHQAREFEESRASPYRALFWEMGTGKSKVVADTASWLYLEDRIDVVVVVAKKGEYANWARSLLPDHMSPDVPYVCAVYRSGLRESEKQTIRDLVKPQPRLRVLCVNVESLNYDSKTRKMTTEGGKVAAGVVKSAKRGVLLVVDESTCVKSEKAARSKAVRALATRCRYRRILSGTPITRSTEDLWGQSLVLGKRLLGCSTLTEFKTEYNEVEKVQYGPRAFNRVTGHKNLDKLTACVSKFGSVLERVDCVDLPPKIYSKVAVPLSDRQAELYAEMRDLAIAELGDGEIVEATNALGVISRLDQIACGQLKRADGTFELIECERLEALTTRLEVSDKRGIVWCNYRGLLAQVYDELVRLHGPELVGRFYGGVPEDERERATWEFQNGSKLRWIVANQQSMGYSWTLTKGKENHYYSNGYNLEHRLQSEDRTMRIGQDEAVNYTDYFAPGTVNEKIFVNLRGKRSVASQVLGTRITDWI